MERKSEEIEELKKLTIEHAWIPARAWNIVTSPDGFNLNENRLAEEFKTNRIPKGFNEESIG